jgi:hypothetical protein
MSVPAGLTPSGSQPPPGILPGDVVPEPQNVPDMQPLTTPGMLLTQPPVQQPRNPPDTLVQPPFTDPFDPAFSGDPNCLIPYDNPPLTDHCEPGVCLPWKADTSCDSGWDALDPHLQENATSLAWSAITALTGGRVASCCVTLRPCLSSNPCDTCHIPVDVTTGATPGGLLRPYLWNGQWYNLTGCLDCSCSEICEIEMPGRVAALLEVNIDGYRYDLNDFRIDNGINLVRQDGCCFPSCQHMGRPYGTLGTFGIKYVPGVAPTRAGLWAVGVLASEFAKACAGGKCRLPSSVTSIVRQGISMEFSQGMFDQGSGIREVDAYVLSVNPNRLKRAPTVYSPDIARGKHRYTTLEGNFQ